VRLRCNAVGGPVPARAPSRHSLGVHRDDLESASLSFSSLSGWAKRGLRDRFIELTDTVWRVRGYGDFLSYCLLAEGAVDIAAEPEVSLWDLAALDIVVREAGGTFTDLAGRPGPHGGNVVATNGLLHDAVVNRLGG
jgi:histidinol-phosphatase